MMNRSEYIQEVVNGINNIKQGREVFIAPDINWLLHEDYSYVKINLKFKKEFKQQIKLMRGVKKLASLFPYIFMPTLIIPSYQLRLEKKVTLKFRSIPYSYVDNKVKNQSYTFQSLCFYVQLLLFFIENGCRIDSSHGNIINFQKDNIKSNFDFNTVFEGFNHKGGQPIG